MTDDQITAALMRMRMQDDYIPSCSFCVHFHGGRKTWCRKYRTDNYSMNCPSHAFGLPKSGQMRRNALALLGRCNDR